MASTMESEDVFECFCDVQQILKPHCKKIYILRYKIMSGNLFKFKMNGLISLSIMKKVLHLPDVVHVSIV